jgi:hypothetical protein
MSTPVSMSMFGYSGIGYWSTKFFIQYRTKHRTLLLSVWWISKFSVPWRCVHARSVRRSTFFQSRQSYRPAEGRVEAKRRQRPGPPPATTNRGARWRSMGELRLGRSVTWSSCGWTYRQSTKVSISCLVHYYSSQVLSRVPTYMWDKLRWKTSVQFFLPKESQKARKIILQYLTYYAATSVKISIFTYKVLLFKYTLCTGIWRLTKRK